MADPRNKRAAVTLTPTDKAKIDQLGAKMGITGDGKIVRRGFRALEVVLAVKEMGGQLAYVDDVGMVHPLPIHWPDFD